MAMKQSDNELLTRIGPGTRMGNLMRRYWWPVGFTEKVTDEPVPVRILGEDLVLFRSTRGRLGLLDRYCAHRRASLELGRVEKDGIRCCYHGWLYDTTGQCREMPAEEPDCPLIREVKIAGYKVEELGGLIFAYMGPDPAPLLPRYDLLVREDIDRDVSASVEHCNWLQRAENGVDTYHSMALHASVYPSIALKRPLDMRWEKQWYGFRQIATYSETVRNTSHFIFPSHTRRYNARAKERPAHFLHLRVPVDDAQTLTFYVKGVETGGAAGKLTTAGFSKPSERGVYQRVKDGWWNLASHEQDRAAQESQGVIADRTKEFLAPSDRTIVLLRKMLLDSIAAIEAGRDPFGLVRDPAQNQLITFDAGKSFSDTDKDYAGNKVPAE
jgi:5,5'-dehydrodivanillate O-demethylase oxygenase subunit